MYRIRIGAHEFKWDVVKERSNVRKHGISFTEAADAFQDELAGRVSLHQSRRLIGADHIGPEGHQP